MLCPPAAKTIRGPLPLHTAPVQQQQQQAGREQKGPAPHPLIKQIFFIKVLFEGTFTSFFKGKKSKRSHKTVEIEVFLTIFD
jgi:hypothetical protein